jgi:hypothetical protein
MSGRRLPSSSSSGRAVAWPAASPSSVNATRHQDPSFVKRCIIPSSISTRLGGCQAEAAQLR